MNIDNFFEIGVALVEKIVVCDVLFYYVCCKRSCFIVFGCIIKEVGLQGKEPPFPQPNAPLRNDYPMTLSWQ